MSSSMSNANTNANTKPNVIIAGCGGGYDIFGGLPLYSQLQSNGHSNIILTNWSFTSVSTLIKYGLEISLCLFKIQYDPLFDAPICSDDVYFPEWYLSKQLNQPIYAFSDPESITQLTEAYLHLINATAQGQVGSIYLVDGGCDVILSGSESELATPVEDMMHLCAIKDLPIPNKYVQIIGANADIGDGVIQSDIDRRLVQLSDQKILIKSEVWDLKQSEVQYYAQTLTQCQPERSIVQSLILASLQGHEGYYTPTNLVPRIGQSVVPISVITRTLYTFNLERLISTILYLPLIDYSMNSDQVDELIMKFQAMLKESQLKLLACE